MSHGESLRSICRDDHMPAEGTVRLWAVQDREGFSTQYARACEAKMEYWADEIVDISDSSNTDTARDKLRVDTRKWLMSKLAARRFGDKVTNIHEGGDKPVEVKPNIDQLKRAIWAVLSKAPTDDKP